MSQSRIVVSQRSERRSQGEVTYIYTSSRGRLIEIIDLTEEPEIQDEEGASNQDEEADTTTEEADTTTAEADTTTEEADTTTAEADTTTEEADTSTIARNLRRRGVTMTKKPKTKKATKKAAKKKASSPAPKRSRKKRKVSSSSEMYCVRCNTGYDDGGGELFSSRCGHIFCAECCHQPHTCCEICDDPLVDFWKIYL